MYSYSSENLLTGASGGVTLGYDPLLRLDNVASVAATSRFVSDGVEVIAETDGAGTTLRRFVRGPRNDELLVSYEGSGLTDRRWWTNDERGSVLASSDGTGTLSQLNRYDEYGRPQPSNAGRFGYAGQMWLPSA